jgi:hypothetical protein
MAMVIPGSIQSNRDRAELVARRRLGTVEDCAKVVEFLVTDLSDYVVVTGMSPAVMPTIRVPPARAKGAAASRLKPIATARNMGSAQQLRSRPGSSSRRTAISRPPAQRLEEPHA